MPTQRKILITGGFGFIGSHLAETLLYDNDLDHLHIVDDLSTSPIEVSSYIHNLQAANRVSWQVCAVEEYFAQTPLPHFTEVYHLANVVGPVGVLRHSGNIVRNTVQDTY